MAVIQFREYLSSDLIGYSDFFIDKSSLFLQKKLRPIIKEYKNESFLGFANCSCSPEVDFNGKKPVWVCWWQGVEKMPDVVKTCYNRVNEVFNTSISEVVLITAENFEKYISVPLYIIEKYQNGIIGKAHFADIIRWGLMAKYGGVWLDATVYITYNSIEKIKNELKAPFFTQKFFKPDECPHEPCRGLWCNFYFMGKHDAKVRIFQFVYDSLLFYWKKYNTAFNYVFLDYIIWAGYQELDDIRRLIDCIPANNKNIWLLSKKMNDEFDEDEWIKLMNNNDFYKLNYKTQWKEYAENGSKTIYGNIINEIAK